MNDCAISSAQWKSVKATFRDGFKSSLHYAIATVTKDGEPHVTPIGSLILGKRGRGFYFEEFPRNLPRHLENDGRLCVLAVNSSRWFWLKSLIGGRFAKPPAVRLHGVAGRRREATDEEVRLWQRRVARVGFTKGHALLWRGMRTVREIEFTRIEPVHLGAMTS